MRKNGVNRELRELEGGVCAPSGFRAAATYCGIGDNPEKPDLGLIMAERRCPVACMYAERVCGAPSEVTKRHVSNGLAQAILVNSDYANVFQENAKEITVKASRLLAKSAGSDAMDTVMASTGKISKELSLEPFEFGIPNLVAGLGATHEHSLSVAEAIRTTDKRAKQLSYSFELGDYECKIGAVFKGNLCICPNMATMLVFLTTDVNITTEMLQNALRVAVNDSLNLLNLDGVSSPNDLVCILANGKAGNYRIACEDSEYKKFVYALKETLREICKALASDEIDKNRSISFKVMGAKSLKEARSIAKTLASSLSIRRSIGKEGLDVDGIYRAVAQEKGSAPLGMYIAIRSKTGSFVALEEGEFLPITEESFHRVYEDREVVLEIRLSDGNYSATSYSCAL